MRSRARLLLGVGAAIVLLGHRLEAQEERTPRAGEPYGDTFLGQPVEAPSRDRRGLTELVLGATIVPGGPDERTFSPTGAVFLWRNREGEGRLRAVLAGIYDEIRWNGPVSQGFETVVTFENTTLPWARSEYVEGVRIATEELKAYQVRAGVGFGYRRPLRPGHQDNAFEADLTYELGYLFFGTGSDTSPSFQMPTETWEDRFHLRIRADAIERNIIELPHSGWAAGGDAVYGHRTSWQDWGGPVTGIQNGVAARTWQAVSAYAVAALPVPFGASERHRLVAMGHGGIGWDLDRFSAFRLGSGSYWGDSETLSRPVLPGAAADEFFTNRYGILDLEYRYQAAFFLYLQLRGTLAWVERPRWSAQGQVVNRTDPMHAVTAGLSTGLPWMAALEVGASYNFGILREGRDREGGLSIVVSLFKEF